jgi:hypothetical protein
MTGGEPPKMNFMLDDNVAASVAEVFCEFGYLVQWTRDVLAAGAPDPLVAKLAELEGAILVSHDKDFKSIAPRIPKGSRNRFRKLSRIALGCPEMHAAARIREHIDYIELAWAKAQRRFDKRMIVFIGVAGFRVDQ